MIKNGLLFWAHLWAPYLPKCIFMFDLFDFLMFSWVSVDQLTKRRPISASFNNMLSESYRLQFFEIRLESVQFRLRKYVMSKLLSYVLWYMNRLCNESVIHWLDVKYLLVRNGFNNNSVSSNADSRIKRSIFLESKELNYDTAKNALPRYPINNGGEITRFRIYRAITLWEVKIIWKLGIDTAETLFVA